MQTRFMIPHSATPDTWSFMQAGIPQVEVVPGSLARVTVAFNLTDDNGTPIDRSVLDALRFTLSHLDVESQTGLTHRVSDILRTQKSTILRASATATATTTGLT